MASDYDNGMHEELSREHHDPLIRFLHGVIRVCIKALAVLMALVILWGVIDVAWVMYQRLSAPPVMLLNVSDIFAVFGAFMVVLIAIEIFINIRLYLGTSMLPVKMVIATALMAIARKVSSSTPTRSATPMCWLSRPWCWPSALPTG